MPPANDKKFFSNLLKVAEFYNVNGRFPVRSNGPEEKALAVWLKTQRMSFNGTNNVKMSDERKIAFKECKALVSSTACIFINIFRVNITCKCIIE